MESVKGNITETKTKGADDGGSSQTIKRQKVMPRAGWECRKLNKGKQVKDDWPNEKCTEIETLQILNLGGMHKKIAGLKALLFDA